MSRTLRFIISTTELQETLKSWAPHFFFYKDGVNEAIKTILSTFQYPTQREHGYNLNGVNPVLHDLSVWFDALERQNALPLNYADVWDAVELAAQEIDEAIYAELRQYLGDVVAINFHATFINKRNDCLIVVEY